MIERLVFNSITSFKLGAIKAAASRSPHTKHQVALEEQVILLPLLCAGSSSTDPPVRHTRSETLQHCIIPKFCYICHLDFPLMLIHSSLCRSSQWDKRASKLYSWKGRRKNVECCQNSLDLISSGKL